MWGGLCVADGERCVGVGSGGRIRTSDLWVMSPTSCHCSTPRHGAQADSPPAVRGARSGLASHRVTAAVLSGAALGHDRVRDGTGWGQGALGHGHPAGRAISHHTHTWGRTRSTTGSTALTTKRCDTVLSGHTPLTIRTPRLQSVTGCPPGAYQPGRLPGVSRTRRSWDVSSRGKIPA